MRNKSLQGAVLARIAAENGIDAKRVSQSLQSDGRNEMLCDGVQITAGDGARFRPVAGSTGEAMNMYWTENASKLQAELASRGVELDAAADVISGNAGAWFAAMGANEQAAVIATMRHAAHPSNGSPFGKAYAEDDADRIAAGCNIAYPPSA